ncbi:MAG: sigma-70 family RNA polymerase sigma factor [Gammaproteobacteria bacterium]|nr:sigma-70 family RNA polymerase sigma factor [Gammaproteobacteria bacterium]
MQDIQLLLISLSKKQDAQLLKALYIATQVRLFSVCLRILKDQQQAEDAMQESFLKIWYKANDYDPNKSQAMTWLSRVVRNQAIDLLRRRNKLVETQVDVNDVPEMIDASPSQISQLEAVEANAKLQFCLATLKKEQVHCIMASYFQGQTAKQIASHLQRPVSTVKSWMARSMPILRKCLENSYEGS